MTIESQLQQKADELVVEDGGEEQTIELLGELEKHLAGNESYKVAKLWKTTPLSSKGAGEINKFDTMALIHTAISERELAKTFYDQLKAISDSEIVNKAVKVNINDTPFNVIPTKFAQQGTIGLGEDDYPYFAEVVGANNLLAKASRLIQHWQYLQDLDLETQSLLPYEIEFTLSHLLHEYEPDTLQELIKLFFQFGKAKRFATQINIFDKHDNILLYHNFIIPDKQLFLESLFDAHDRFVSDDPDLSIFGI